MSSMFTQKYDNDGYWLDRFDGKNLALPLHKKNGETYNTPVKNEEEASALYALGYIPKGREYQKMAGFKKRR